MSRKTAIVEEFDDDTELPLPSLPNTGSAGPLLEEISSSESEDDIRAGPASRPTNTVTDITPYKNWTCIYPIYIDAKRPYGTGERRVARQKSVWWPLSKDIADASNRLGFGTLHEVGKTHPRDWENPGRVRVLWKKDGRLMNPRIKTKKQLLEQICLQIQHLKPENIPRPPYITTPTAGSSAIPPQQQQQQQQQSSNKGKAPATTKSKLPAPPSPGPNSRLSGRKLPIPPEPHPPLASRVSPYSPALSTGVLIETVKAGMNAQEANAGGGGPGGGGFPGMQKGKRKVVRVRG